MMATSLWNNSYAQNSPPSEMAAPPKDGKHNGLQIDRSKLLKSLISYDSTLNFKQVNEAEKMPLLVAHGINNSNIEVTGTENNLRKISYQVFLNPGTKESLQSCFYQIGNVIGTIIPRNELMRWMVKHYTSINTSPQISIKQSYSMTGNLLVFNYDPSAKSITLIVSTEYN